MQSGSQGVDGLVGRDIAGYRLERVIGTGATSAVLLGRRAVFGATQADEAAIKILILPWQLDIGERATFRARFEREAAILQHLHDPGNPRHLVPVLAFGEQDDLMYMVQPYMAGGTLAGKLAAGPLALQEAASYLVQIAEALDYAHSRGLVHRDVKPANILLDTNSQAYLADFGIAHLFQTSGTQLTTTGRVLGTPTYMAPEQFMSDPVSPATDIYSLGAVLYQMVTGRTPFHAKDWGESLRQHVYVIPPSPEQWRTDLPVPAAVSIRRALAKVPSQRFASANALAQAFTLGLQGIGPSTITEDELAALPPSVTKPAPTLASYAPLPTAISHPATISSRSPISRRQVLVGLGALGVTLVGAIGIAEIIHQGSQSNTGSNNQGTNNGTGAASPGTVLYVYRGHSAPVYALTWSPDNNHVVSGSVDQTVHLWSASGGADDQIYAFTAQPNRPAKVRGLDWGKHAEQVAMVAEDGLLALYSSSQKTVIKVAQSQYCNPYVRGVSWSADNTRIVIGGNNGRGEPQIEIWDASLTTLIYHWSGHHGQVTGVRWSPSGDYIVTTSDDNTAKVWSAETFSLVSQFTGHTSRVYSASWSPDSRMIVTGSNDGTAQIWQADSGTLVRQVFSSPQAVFPVAWSPNGKYIAVSGGDATIHVWNTASWQALAPFYGHASYVDVLAWSPDSTRIASGSDDATARIWQVE